MNCIRTVKGKSTELVNESIPNVELLVIDQNGNNLGNLKRETALELALRNDLDLVVVAPDAKPMVAKFIDYPKYRYEQQKKLREMKKNQKNVQLKEIRLSPTIDKHDFDTKVRQASKFLQGGDKVKVSIRFQGRMITHRDVGEEVMNKFILEVGKNAVIESKPKLEGRFLMATLAPNSN